MAEPAGDSVSGASKAPDSVSGASRALIGLGSNLGEPLEQLRAARRELQLLGRVDVASSLYRTAPVGGPPGQAHYLNAVVLLSPAPELASPRSLLTALLGIERRSGRRRRVRWDARTLDLDLLAYGDAVIHQPGLILPHPRLMDRPFMLAPLCEVAPAWRHPVSGRGACEALEALPPADINRIGLDWAPG
jgi:2-amino-4-hydroxy-6-hydroxymethyldihydropteridine diphosphokinase